MDFKDQLTIPSLDKNNFFRGQFENLSLGVPPPRGASTKRGQNMQVLISGPENLRSTFGCVGPHLRAILRVLTIKGHCHQERALKSHLSGRVNSISRVPPSWWPWRGPSLTSLENSVSENHCEAVIQCEAFFPYVPKATPLSSAPGAHCVP